MAADVYVIAVDPFSGAIAVDTWVGLTSVRERLQGVLGRGADHIDESADKGWGSLNPSELESILGSRAVGGIDPTKAQALLASSPLHGFRWRVVVSR